MKQQYLLDTCICICWLRDKYGVRERIRCCYQDYVKR
jgi:hypothetical protein